MTNTLVQTSWKLPVLLSLLLVLPQAALAADEPSLSPPPMPEAKLTQEGEPPVAQRVPSSHPALRVGAELGGELALSLGGAFAGFFAGAAACETFYVGSGGLDFTCLNYAALGMLTGAALAAPVGAWGGGKLAGGRGTLGSTYLGAGAGAATGLVVSLMLTNDNMKPFFPPVLAMVGTVIGYELSHSSESEAQQASLTRIQPMLSVSERGGALGLSGRF